MPDAHLQSKQHSDPAIVGTLVVQPEEMAKLVAGSYYKHRAQPTFNFGFQPNRPDAMGISLEVIEHKRTNTLIYHLQNFGDEQCLVTVTRAD
jgi:hypothetical protein